MDILVERIKNNDERAFCNIMSTYGGRLLKFASIYTLDDQVSREIVQDCFLTLWFKRSALREDTCLITYLMVMCRNRCLNYISKRKTEILHLEDVEKESLFLSSNEYVLNSHAMDALITQDLSKALEQAINKLPKRTRDIFLLSRKEGLKNRQIAEQLQIAPKTVEYHLTKALSFLRNELKDDLVYMLIHASLIRYPLILGNYFSVLLGLYLSWWWGK